METPRHAANSQEIASALTSLCSMEYVDDERDEAQMIQAVLNGHRSVFAELVRPYEPVLYRIALGTLRNQADAEDVTQETLLRAFHKLPSFRSEARFSTWLITIAMNEARGLLRWRKVRGVAAAGSSCDEPAQSPELLVRDQGESPHDRLVRAELGSLLRAAISTLPPAYKAVLQLRIFDEQCIRTTAQTLNWSEGAVKVRLYRARRMLRRQLQECVDRGAAPPAHQKRSCFARPLRPK